jgi:hypothetical protein
MVVPVAPTKIFAFFLLKEREIEKRERERQRQRVSYKERETKIESVKIYTPPKVSSLEQIHEHFNYNQYMILPCCFYFFAPTSHVFLKTKIICPFIELVG